MAPVSTDTDVISRRRASLKEDVDALKSIFRSNGVQSKDDIYSVNDGRFYDQTMIPDPLPETNYPPPESDYDPSNEPKFNAKLHLALEDPEFVAIMKNGQYTPTPKYKCTANKSGSEFMYSAPFELFSVEGARIARKILTAMKRSAKHNGRSKCMRGIYYLSPWFRDMMTNREYLKHMEAICGEPVYAHMYLQQTQMNVGTVGGGVVDQWHFDSVCYVCVSLLSDIDDMVGGDLELVKHTKSVAIDKIINGTYTDEDLVKVPYKRTGYAILAQGSKIIHHVTPVEYAKEDRISLIISLSPANAYHPDRTVYNSMQKLDCNYRDGVPEFEFFRQKMWQMSKILEDYVKNEKFVDDKHYYARKVRAVSKELDRVADLLDGSLEDKIGFFAEKGQGSPWLK